MGGKKALPTACFQLSGWPPLCLLHVPPPPDCPCLVLWPVFSAPFRLFPGAWTRSQQIRKVVFYRLIKPCLSRKLWSHLPASLIGHLPNALSTEAAGTSSLALRSPSLCPSPPGEGRGTLARRTVEGGERTGEGVVSGGVSLLQVGLLCHYLMVPTIKFMILAASNHLRPMLDPEL